MAEEIKKILEDYKEETKRHFDIVAEDLKDQIQTVVEQVAANTEKLEEHDKRFNQIDGKLSNIEDTLEIIKLDIEFISSPHLLDPMV